MNSNPAISRRLYALLLRLNPRPFRERFAAEMQFIFDEERARGVPIAGLLLDALFSAARQQFARVVASFDGQIQVASGYVEISGRSVAPARLLQALVLMLVAGAMLGSVCAAGDGDIGPRLMRPFSDSSRYPGSGRVWLITPAPFTTHTRQETRPK